MDKRIRRNELCVIGLPRCDFVFSSTRSCFIGYGFKQSSLEMNILRHLLEKRGIEPVEAGGTLAPAQNAFCSKICSKIIISQFCIALVNNDEINGIETPNANVNMEYGLMLGFNKYVIPFQREGQSLPFNVAGLDTVKYTNASFEGKAADALDVAIKATAQDAPPTISSDQILESLLVAQRLLVVPLATDGDRNLYQLGKPLGFNLLMSFNGMKYTYFGNFAALRPEAALWRLRTLEEIIQERLSSVPERVKMGIVEFGEQAASALKVLMDSLQFLLLVTSDEDRNRIQDEIKIKPTKWPVRVLSLKDLGDTLKGIS